MAILTSVPPQKPVMAIGIMSGTSMDGIDVAALTTDGLDHVVLGPSATFDYPETLRSDLLAHLAEAGRFETESFPELEAAVTEAHADAALRFIHSFGIVRDDVAVIGMHGQTMLHRPERRFTCQLGNGQQAANRTGLPVVCRFRHADVAAGGQGAPLVPVFHRALAAQMKGPIMVLNLGGVANVTYIDGDTLIAFDTGPASALIDDFMRRRRGVAMDRGGELAAAGQADQKVLGALLSHSYFARKPPKSLDRNDFHTWSSAIDGLSDADGAATLTRFTVESVTAALRHVPCAPRRWLVTGGGRHNCAIMVGLEQALAVTVDPVEAVGWDGNGMEAHCFGYLAVRSLRGQPLSFPGTTGVPRPMPGGELFRPA
jgi:anhydro-N-acetylmuramic acid kinase